MGGFLWNWETSSKLASNLTFKQAFGCTHSHKPYASYALRPKVSVFNCISKYRKAFGPIGWIHCNPETICAWNTVATNTQRCCKLKLSSIAWFVTNHIGLDLHFESLEFRQPPLFKTISSFLTPFLVRLPFGILFWSFDPCNYIIFCKNIEKSKFDLEVMMTSTSGSLKKLKTRHLMVSTNKPLQIAPLLNLKSAF